MLRSSQPEVEIGLAATGEVVRLQPGDVIGRHRRCALCIPDPRVSEAHAMVALRGGKLHLLSLRGGVTDARGEPLRDPPLVLRQRLCLAPGVDLVVRALRLPEVAAYLVGPGLDLPLERPVALAPEPGGPPRVRPIRPDGAGVALWSDGIQWFVRRDGASAPAPDGTPVAVGAWVGRIELRALTDGSLPQTDVTPAIRLVCAFHTVHVWVGAERRVTVSGVLARILHELAELAGPVHWQALANAIWKGDLPEHVLRRRWDANLHRLRRQLDAGGLRADLVRSDQRGHIELLLHPHDTVVLDA
ncbi:MAG: FHA domain-containing protein [Alphaproteobacteria bacterium]|nr:FHA domain-containing protein [Alphaproteobacteria bacterium]